MRVIVSSVGRFHAFDLARQLLRHGFLRHLYTGYPLWKIDSDLRVHSQSFPWLTTPQFALARYGLHSLAESLNQVACNTFDHWVAKKVTNTDVLVAQSQSGLRSFYVAHAKGIRTVCLRGSSHIVYQNEILHEEYSRHGINIDPVPRWAIEKELAEYTLADLIEINSIFVYESFLQHGVSANKLLLVPQGVDLSMFKPIPKTDDIFRVVFVGTLSIRKGIRYLLEAVATLKLPRFEVWLIGSPLYETRSILAAYKDKVTSIGVVSRNELYKYYSQASVFVLPSIEDGFGSVIAQAMACGLPVIATTNTGGPDIITEGVEGFIVPIRNPDAIREKLEYLYQNPDIRDNMAQAALRRVQSVGGWDEYGERSLQAYKRLIG